MTNLQITPILNAESQCSDPFIGGSRYISNSFPSTSRRSSIPAPDPPNSLVKKSYIPQTDYLKLEQGNVTAICGNSKDAIIIKQSVEIVLFIYIQLFLQKS